MAMHLMRQTLLSLWLAATAVAWAQAQSAPQAYRPQVGQQGRDVVWVPTAQALVDRMLDLAQVTPNDYVIDLGSGDGRTVIAAAKRGARALGIEYNPEMVELSRRNAAQAGVGDKAAFAQADLFETDLSQAAVITLFLLPDINLKLRPKLLALRPGTRIVSNSFTMGEWAADEAVSAGSEEGCATYCTAYLWIVPAQVDGTWRLPQGELALKQTFQTIAGTLKSAAGSVRLRDGRLRGDRISFTAAGVRYTGRVNGNTIEGTVNHGGKPGPWSATRAGKPAG